MIIEEFSNEEIEDEEEMSEFLSESYFTPFLEELEKQPKMLEPLDDDTEWMRSEGVSFLWSWKATKLIDEELARLHAIGQKYFPDGDIEITSHLYKEI